MVKLRVTYTELIG